MRLDCVVLVALVGQFGLLLALCVLLFGVQVD